MVWEKLIQAPSKTASKKEGDVAEEDDTCILCNDEDVECDCPCGAHLCNPCVIHYGNAIALQYRESYECRFARSKALQY